MLTKINHKLRVERLKRRWAYPKAGQETGVTAETFMRWELGRQNPQLFNLDRLCTVFEKSPEELGFGDLVSDNNVLDYKPRGPKKSGETSNNKQ